MNNNSIQTGIKLHIPAKRNYSLLQSSSSKSNSIESDSTHDTRGHDELDVDLDDSEDDQLHHKNDQNASDSEKENYPPTLSQQAPSLPISPLTKKQKCSCQSNKGAYIYISTIHCILLMLPRSWTGI